jgi:hypothetical protein
MDRKQEIKNQIADFLRATGNTRRNMLTYGIEVEYQRSGADDIDWDADYDDIYDMEAVCEAECVQAEELAYSYPLEYVTHYMVNKDILKFLPKKHRYYRDIKPILKIIHNTLDNTDPTLDDLRQYWEDLNTLFRYNNFDEFRCELYDEARGHVEVDWEPYIRDDAPRLSDIDTDYTCCDDQSVSGGEIKTDDAWTYDDILNATDTILTDIRAANGCYIDKDCSFHVHVQLGDIYHVYGTGKIVRYIMQYIALNFDQLPSSVRDRLYNGGNRWIYPRCDNNKYRWVHVHDQGTVEFRLFGNISEYGDGVACIDFVSKALAYAYKAVRRKLPLVNDRCIDEALSHNRPYSVLDLLKTKTITHSEAA